jgi:uncharacterized protein YabN with tetrapyrrole methylase and pyrophosphatase domain
VGAPVAAAGSLTIVGIGIRFALHLTPEAKRACARADELLYLAVEPASSAWVAELNPNSRSLDGLYHPDEERSAIYERIVEELLRPVREGRVVCAAFYGHPGVFVAPAHAAIERARSEGLEASMLPGISAEDCLFADLGVDPADTGCQSYEATDFLLRGVRPDTSASLVLWQISVIGQTRWSPEPNFSRLPVLVEALRAHYPADHLVTVYEASPYPLVNPHVERVPLDELAAATITPMSTLYVPPCAPRSVDPLMRERLGMS